MKTQTFAALLICLSLAAPSAAFANSYSMLTAGFGSNFGVSSTGRPGRANVSTLSSEFSLRVKALRVMGIELAYSPTDAPVGRDGLVFQNSLRLSGLLYLVPTRYVSAYAKVGIEGSSLSALISVSDPSNSYHAGGGLEIELTDHISLGLEFLVLVPGYKSVETRVLDYVEREAGRIAEEVAGGRIPTNIGADAPQTGDFLSASNFRMTIGARYYF